MILTDPLFGPDYRIVVDKHQYTVQKRSMNKKTNKDHWTGQKYCSTLGGALTHIVMLKAIKDYNEMTLRQYVSYIEESITKIITRLNY